MKLMYAHLFVIKHADIRFITEKFISMDGNFFKFFLVQPHLLVHGCYLFDTLLTNGTAATHGVFLKTIACSGFVTAALTSEPNKYDAPAVHRFN